MTDRTESGEGSSSEDLIRQARQAYEPTSAVAPEAPPRSEPAPPRSAPGTGADGAAMNRPSDYVRSDYQVEPAPVPPGDGTTYVAQRPSFFQRFGGLLVGLAIVVGFIVFNIFDRTTDVDALAIGDCLRMPDAEEISSVESADCADPHELEVFGLVTLTQGGNAPYPGEDAVAEAIFELCLPRFQPYVGTSYDNSVWYINAIFPTRDSWVEADDRSGTCVLYQPGAPGEDALSLTGSARGSSK